jgi:hypothetical protein
MIIKNISIISLILSLFVFFNCSQNEFSFKNKELKEKINEYINYADSCGYKLNYDYIIIDCSIITDTVTFSVYLSGGAYNIIYDKQRFIDFIDFKKHSLLFLGSFPSEFFGKDHIKRFDSFNEIIKEKYPDDYIKYLKEPHSVFPNQYDSMEMEIKFKNGKLISCSRNYF